MFRLFSRADGSLDAVQQRFLEMLTDGRRVFDLAMSARVGGADPATLAHDLERTEEGTDEAEREIRRLLLVHASVAGAADLPACLMYMSIAKDAERISDLSKAIFGLAELIGPPGPGPILDDLVALRERVSAMIGETVRIFRDEDTQAAAAFIGAARDLQRHCRDQIHSLVREDQPVAQPAATVLTYRHTSRVVSNLLNVVSSVVMSLDRLDYPGDEEDFDEPGGP